MDIEQLLQTALKVAGETIGEVSVTGIVANVQLAAAQEGLAAAHARIELLATALADREVRIRVLQDDRDAWRTKAEKSSRGTVRAKRNVS